MRTWPVGAPTVLALASLLAPVSPAAAQPLSLELRREAWNAEPAAVRPCSVP